MNFPSVTSLPNFTSGETLAYSRTRLSLVVTRQCSVRDGKMKTCVVSAGPFTRHDRARRGEQDRDVAPHRRLPRVAQIEADHFVERGPAAAGHLPEAGDPRLRVDHAPAMPGLVLLELVLQWWPRPDE